MMWGASEKNQDSVLLWTSVLAPMELGFALSRHHQQQRRRACGLARAPNRQYGGCTLDNAWHALTIASR